MPCSRIPRASMLLLAPLLMAMSVDGGGCSTNEPYKGPEGVEGRIFFEVLDDATGQLAGDAEYVLTRSNSGELITEGTTSATGQTRIRGLEAGGYTLVVTKPGYVSVQDGYTFSARTGQPFVTQTVESRLDLLPASASLELQLLHPSGEPLQHEATVVVFQWGEPYATEGSHRVIQEPLVADEFATDENGHLDINGWPATRVVLTIRVDLHGDGAAELYAQPAIQLIADSVLHHTVQLKTWPPPSF